MDTPDWLNEKPVQLVKLPIETRINLLPLQDLTWENFERLIYRLVRKKAYVHECRLYGVKGQRQKGIDIIACSKDLNERRPIVYQCRRIKKISKTDIENIVTTFLSEEWDPLPSKFALCCSKSIRKTHLIDQIGIERERLAEYEVIFSVWDQEEISALLKGYPNIVEDFFGREWVRAFIGDEYFSSKVSFEGIIMNNDEVTDLNSYHRLLYNRSQWLELPAIHHPLSRVGKKETRLRNVYISLETLERVATCEDVLGNVHRILQKDIEELGANIQCVENWKLVQMSVMEALKFYNKVVLLGGRDSGKSTAIQYLLLCLAADYITDQTFWMESLKDLGWTHGFLIPIFISLADFSKAPNVGPNANALWDFFRNEFRVVSNSVGPVKKALDKGKAVILLDDLHRVPVEKRSMTVNAILDFTRLYPLCRYVVTCRERNYHSKDEIMLAGFRPVTLAPLVPRKINKFIDDLYTELRHLDWKIPEGAANDLKNAVHNSDLIQLAENPSLLTQMALLHSSHGKLPDDRVHLYSEMLESFLNSKNIEYETLTKLSEYLIPTNIDLRILENALYEIAYLAFLEEGKGSSGVEKSRVINVMQYHLKGDTEKAIKFCDFVESTLGFLAATENNMFVFPNKTLQEYMVAQYLQSQNDFISKGVDLAKEDFSKWHKVFAMATRLAGTDMGTSAVRSMCPFEPPSEVRNIKKKEIDWYTVWMAAEALSELGLIKVKERPERLEVLERIRQWLILLIKSNALTVRERNDIGKLLSKVGDIRDGVSTIKPYLVKIPKGFVVLGNDRITKGRTYRFDIPYDYYASKYLVTNAQYAMFLSENPTYPLPEDEQNVWKTSARTPNPQFLNHPVVGVTWNDARLYCQWSTKKLASLNILRKNYIARLPTDAEWMKMYRGGEQLPGGTQNPYPTRLYPWGNKWVEGYGNEPEKKTSLYQTTTVGIYPKGTTPYGILDACGNVLEWTSTSWGSFDIEVPGFSYPYNVLDGRESLDAEGLRIVRGGSWLFSEGDAKCACRLHPSNKFPDTGFRVFVGPKDILTAFGSKTHRVISNQKQKWR